MVYLDNNATTPLDPAVAEKMSLFLKEHFGNPSSLYPLGRAAKNVVTQARETIAQSLGAIMNLLYLKSNTLQSLKQEII